MKTVKRLLVICLAVVMCLTAFAVTPFAASQSFNAAVTLSTRYTKEGDKIILSVLTDKECGAIKATVTYPADAVDFDEENTRFIEKPATATPEYYNNVAKEGKLTFVVTADDLEVGNTHWANIYFKANTSDTISFSVDNIQVCDVNENLDKAVAADDAKITVEKYALKALGTQQRIADAAKNVKAALRFGSRIDRTQVDDASMIETQDGTLKAVSCGYVVAYTATLDYYGLDLDVYFDGTKGTQGYVAPADSKAMLLKFTTKTFINDPNYLVYTASVINIEDTYGQYEIQAMPFVVYEKEDGTFGIMKGAIIKNSYNKILKIKNQFNTEIYSRDEENE